MATEAGETPQQCLTPPESVTIIATLCAAEAYEKRQARLVVGLQTVAVLVATVIAYWLAGTRDAAAILSGGLVSVFNGVLLAWRMSRTARCSWQENHHSGGAHRQLRLMYFYAVERFLAVVVLLGWCMVVLEVSPLVVLGGFVTGQAMLLAARLFLNGLNRS